MSREPISKKLRFEVFKRDSFTCQYCGRKAPEAVLHCDHIHPVAEGGTSDILNLVTACEACNLGKGARLLDDQSVVERQTAQLAELQARREQLEMMLEWRDAIQRDTIDVVEQIAARVAERGHGWRPSDSGKSKIRKWLKSFSVLEILEALDTSFDRYMRVENGKGTQSSWETAFSKIPAIANINRQAASKPWLPKAAYIQGICRNRFDDYQDYIEDVEEAHLQWGLDLDTIERLAKRADNWKEWRAAMQRAAAAGGGR